MSRYHDVGVVVGIEGDDSSFAVAVVAFCGSEDEVLANIPVRELEALGPVAINSTVFAEVSETGPLNPVPQQVEYLTDEDMDAIWYD